MNWSTLLATPLDICTRITAQIGGGACGFNSLCKPEGNGRRTCECPSGYTLIDPTCEMSGCKQNFTSQSCDSDETDFFNFTEMQYTNWPLSDYEHF